MADNKEIVKEYTNGELTVVWKPASCIHSTKCWKGLYNVFNPRKKPWVNMEGSSTERIQKQVDECPSGALSYYFNKKQKTENMESKIKIYVMENGPLLVDGIIEVCKADGSTENKTKTTAFCRCGASSNKPYCDGQHKKVDFTG